MVGGLVEEEDVRLLQEQAAEGHAAAFATGEGCYGLVVGGALEGVHRAFELRVDIPCVGGVESVLKFGLPGDEGVHLVWVFEHVGVAERFVYLFELGEEVHCGLDAFAHDVDYGLFGVEPGFLFEISDGVTRGENDFALIFLVDSGYNFQERRFTGTVESDDADFGTVEKGEVDVFEYLFLGRVYF